MTKKKKILILVLYLILALIFLFCVFFQIPCLSKVLFHIPCPACGIGRATILILQFKFLESFSYSILAQPTLLLLLFCFIINLYDLFKNQDNLSKFWQKFSKHYFLIIIYLIISWIVNIYRGI